MDVSIKVVFFLIVLLFSYSSGVAASSAASNGDGLYASVSLFG